MNRSWNGAPGLGGQGDQPTPGGRRVTVAQVWVKVDPQGQPHPKAAQLMDEIRDQYPGVEVRLDREQGYYDRALLKVLHPEGPEAQRVARGVQELIRSFRGGSEANLLTGKVFTLRVPVDAKGEVTDARARGVLDEVKKQYPRAEFQQQQEGGVATIEIYLREITDAQRFLAAYHAIRNIVRRHKTEPGAPSEQEE